jgi:acyl-CoA reductase-like NAD-dependent aldehyde dehydrogenase
MALQAVNPASRLLNSGQSCIAAKRFIVVEPVGQAFEERLAAGKCFVNDFVRSHPRLPFGGVGQSGYGRELSHCGRKEFVNIKTVRVR